MERNDACPIWGTPARILEKEPGGDYENIDSPRAGGKYWISGTAIAMIQHLGTQEKVLLTDWLVEQRKLGNTVPQITTDVLQDIHKRIEMTVFSRADGLLHFIQQQSSLLGDIISFDTSNDSSPPDTNLQMLAWTGSESMSEVLTLAEYLSEQEWTELREGHLTSSHHPYELMIKPKGYKHIADLQGEKTESANCFIAMWFGDEVNSAYVEAIKPAVIKSGYTPIRVDEIEHDLRPIFPPDL